jgi:hypothetical protein
VEGVFVFERVILEVNLDSTTCGDKYYSCFRDQEEEQLGGVIYSVSPRKWQVWGSNSKAWLSPLEHDNRSIAGLRQHHIIYNLVT